MKRQKSLILERPKVMISEKEMTVLLGKDKEGYSALCPELDLVTEMDTPEEAFKDIVEAMKEYAKEYLDEFELYSKSPNRSHHLPYIRAIASCKSHWELLSLLEVRYGVVHLQSV